MMAWPCRSSTSGVSRARVGPRPPDETLCEGRGDRGFASPALGPPAPGQASETHLVRPRPHCVARPSRPARALVVVLCHAGDDPRLAPPTRSQALDLSEPQAWAPTAASRDRRAPPSTGEGEDENRSEERRV